MFDELCKLQPPEPPVNPEPPVQPPINPTDQPSDDSNPTDDGNPSDKEGDNKGDSDTPTKGDKPPTSPDQGEDEVGDAKSPVKRTKTRADGGKVKVIVNPRSTEPTPNVPEEAKAGGASGEWAVAPDTYHVSTCTGAQWKINF